MSARSPIWGLLGVILVVVGVFVGLKSAEHFVRPGLFESRATTNRGSNSVGSTAKSSASGNRAAPVPGRAAPTQARPSAGASIVAVAGGDPKFPHRLKNSGESLNELARRETALLLDNALIDTAVGVAVDIPEHLRSAGDPGSYIIQADRPLNSDFYALLRAEGAKFVSYIPNNAALVRIDAGAVERMAKAPGIRAVLPYEPYYKIARNLLSTAVDQTRLPQDARLDVVLFPGEQEHVLDAFAHLGVRAVAEDRTPFGPLITVDPPPESLPALAQLTGVQRIEWASPRVLLNDLARVRVAVASNSVTETNYLGLSGSNVWVNLNDTGVDASHPDLVDRVFSTDTNSFTLLDLDGHGTHVAGTLAGSGVSSDTITNAVGSVPGANFRGMAPMSELYVLPIDLRTGPLISDTYLQEAAATNHYVVQGKTNAFISNNSWGYQRSFEYNSSAASFDAAVRDTLPKLSGSQPAVYVFAAGNEGFGTDDGVAGSPDTIISPATAKNVITVGALEQFRLITTEVYTTNSDDTIVTNQVFRRLTDSDSEVASYSSRGNVGIGSEGEFGRFKPDVVAPGSFLVSARSAQWKLENDLLTNSPLYPAFSNLNSQLEPNYRYESGTSMAAPVVSGVLALLQEYFERVLHEPFTPALMKALLINGARTVNSIYDVEVRKINNAQGWGVANLTNSLPVKLTNTTDRAGWPLRFFDMGTNNALATGQAQTWDLKLTTNGVNEPLRVTLVWTDPPGNPGSAIKLVNDLDLVVTNLETGEVFVGNDIPQDGDFNQPTTTNTSPAYDFVNNVECVFLNPLLGTNYSISVVARRVNVNAVTANTTGVVQDYALVISSGNGTVEKPFDSLERIDDAFELPPALGLTNGVPVLNQRAGANFQLLSSTNGLAEQWRFYLFTNEFVTNVSVLTNGSNVAIITFLPPNLARPRNLDADIDLYVSQDSELTNLEPTAVANAFKSITRSGTEVVVFTNAVVGSNEVFYIGVKSEDQQAAEFGIVALSSDQPFDEEDENGNRVLRGLPTNIQVEDGSPNNPGSAYIFAVGLYPVEVAGVVAELEMTHQSVGDLIGNLSHEDQFAVLNNHSRFEGGTNLFYRTVYDDNNSGLYNYSRPTDGPGNLNDFIGLQNSGVWLFTMTDDALGRTGLVNSIVLRVQPNRLSEGGVIDGSVLANQWVYYSISVPPDAVRLTALLSKLDQQGLPLDLYLRRGQAPNFDEYDKKGLIQPPGGGVSITRGDVPPLNGGRYFIGIYNPNAETVNFGLQVLIDRDLDAVNALSAISEDTPLVLSDDAITRSTIFVPSARPVVDVQAGVVVEHARASDLVFHLVSPQGTRVLLAENRGQANPDGYGDRIITTNVFPRTSSGGPEEDRNTFDTGGNAGILQIDYDFIDVPDTLRVYYQGALIYDSGLVSGVGSIRLPFGPGDATEITIVVNEGGSSLETTLWSYTASVITERLIYTVLTENTNRAELPIKYATAPFTNSTVSNASTNTAILRDDFELYAEGLYTAPTNLGIWLVDLGQVVVHGPTNSLGVSANTGSNFVELAVSNAPSSLTAIVDTTVNRRYILNFAMHQNPIGTPDAPQVLAIYTNDALSAFLPVSAGGWVTNSILLRALSSSTAIEFRSGSPVGPLIDSVEIIEVADEEEFYFLPEEFLSAFQGESAFGNWTLEMWDNRVGPDSGPQPELISWQLQFVLANTNPPALPLVFCRPDTNTVSVYKEACEPVEFTVTGEEIKYFIVEVPRSASIATNLVTSTNDLVLLFNQDGLPTGSLPGDTIVNDFGPGGEVFTLDTNSLPSLQPGQRYYLGVANADPAETNRFFISVAFDQTDNYLVSVLELTNAIPYTATIDVTNALDYYQYTVASNAVQVRFEIPQMDGNVDLVIRKALPIQGPLPTTAAGHYDYVSRNPGTEPEEIIVTPMSDPVPLEAGRWYLGVVNIDTNPVTYTVLVTETVGASTNVIQLENGVPLDFTIPAGSAVTNYFLFSIAEATNSAVLFEAYNLTGDATMYAEIGAFPSPPLNFFGSDPGSPTDSAQIVFRTNSGAPANLMGDWFLRVVPDLNQDLDFSIRAVLATNGVLVSGAPLELSLHPSPAPATGLELTWKAVRGERYQVSRSVDLVTWVPLGSFTASSTTVSFQDPAPPPATMLYYRVDPVP